MDKQNKHRVLVIGASVKPDRYANIAINRLLDAGHDVMAISNRKGEVRGVEFLLDHPPLDDIDTVTLYVNPDRQKDYEDYIMNLQPRRVIFNPGTVNPPFMKRLSERGVEVLDACTLVMLSAGTF